MTVTARCSDRTWKGSDASERCHLIGRTTSGGRALRLKAKFTFVQMRWNTGPINFQLNRLFPATNHFPIDIFGHRAIQQSFVSLFPVRLIRRGISFPPTPITFRWCYRWFCTQWQPHSNILSVNRLDSRPPPIHFLRHTAQFRVTTVKCMATKRLLKSKTKRPDT